MGAGAILEIGEGGSGIMERWDMAFGLSSATRPSALGLTEPGWAAGSSQYN